MHSPSNDQAAEDGSLREQERLELLSEIQFDVAASPAMGSSSSRRGSIAASLSKRDRDQSDEAMEVKHRRISSGATDDLLLSPNSKRMSSAGAGGSDSRHPSLSYSSAPSHISSSIPAPSPFAASSTPVPPHLQPVPPPIQLQAQQHSQQYQSPPPALIGLTPQQQAFIRQQQAANLINQQQAMMKSQATTFAGHHQQSDSSPSSLPMAEGVLSRPTSSVDQQSTMFGQSQHQLDTRSASEQYASLQAIFSSPNFLSHPANLRQQLQLNAQQLMYRMQAETAAAALATKTAVPGGSGSVNRSPSLGSAGGAGTPSSSTMFAPSPTIGGSGRSIGASFGEVGGAGASVESSSSYFREQYVSTRFSQGSLRQTVWPLLVQC